MKNLLLPILFPLGCFLVFFTPVKKPVAPPALSKNDISSCGPSSIQNIEPGENGKYIGVLPGWAHYAYPVSTSNDSTQFYFDQGLNMYYSYHAKEAIASFKEAARMDTACAMAYWGQALAMGPGYNSAHNYTIPEAVPATLQKMNQHIGSATEKEKKLIAAMNSRYPADITTNKRKALDAGYAGSLNTLINLYPADMDIKMLYVDAVMLIHPWDFWNNDGTAKKWTPELLKLSETVVKAIPTHPAALHYYIHLTEASRHPEWALASAEGLKTLLPGVAHMIHMASHEYERNGLYEEGITVNERADEALHLYDSLAKNLSLTKHSPHYFAVQTYCALSGGMYEKGMWAAIRCRKSVAPVHENTYDQYLYMMPTLTLVRLGKWSEILRDNIPPDTRWAYANVLYNFARGLAWVNTGQTDSAVAQLTALKNRMKDSTLTVRRIPFNSALQGTGIAAGILDAAILFAQKKYEPAINSLTKTIRLEDSMTYSEPRDWLIPARQFLGFYLLKLGRPALAEKIYREDLVWNPGNGWSYLGLSQSLEALKKKKGLANYKSRYQKAFSRAEQLPPRSIF